MNSIVLGGRLCDGGKLAYSADSKPYFRGSLAVWNSWQKESEFFDIVIFGKKAELFEEWSKRGDFVNVKGEVSINKWTDKSGNKRTNWSVRVADFELPRSKDHSDAADGRPDGKSFPDSPAEGESERGALPF